MDNDERQFDETSGQRDALDRARDSQEETTDPWDTERIDAYLSKTHARDGSESYLEHAKRELEKIREETGPERQAHLREWLEEQRANTGRRKGGYSVAGDLSREERLEISNMAEEVTQELLRSTHSLDAMAELIKTKTQLDYNLDHPIDRSDPKITEALVQDTLLLAAIEYARGNGGNAQMIIQQAMSIEAEHGIEATKEENNEIVRIYLDMIWKAIGRSGDPPVVN